jgi:hypothetical protein
MKKIKIFGCMASEALLKKERRTKKRKEAKVDGKF